MGIFSIAGFAFLGLVVCGLSVAVQAHFSGWYRLAKRYRASTPFSGRTWHLRATSFRAFTSYWLTFVIGANREGIYLAQCWPWSWTHPPLFVPWGDVKFEHRRWYEVWARSMLLGRDHAVRVTMGRGIVAEMQGYKSELLASA